MTTADRIANGEDAHVPVRAATRKIRRVVRRRVPIAAPPTPMPAEDFDIESAFAASPPEVHAGPTPNIDPVLFDILKSEVAQHLGVIGDYLDRCAPTPVVASEMLLRAVHTLNGAIAMVDIPALGHVLAPLEGYIKRLRGIAAAPGADGIAALEDTVALARDVVQRLDMGIGELPDSTDLVLRVTALRDALPEPETSLHLYSGSGPEAIEAPVAVAVEETHLRHRRRGARARGRRNRAPSHDARRRRRRRPHRLADPQRFDGHEAETAAPFAEMPAEIAASLSEVRSRASRAARSANAADRRAGRSVEPSFGSSATLVDAALFAAFDDAGAEPELRTLQRDDRHERACQRMTPVEDEADLYVPDDEVPAVAFEADDVDDFSESPSRTRRCRSGSSESREAEVAMPIEDEAVLAPIAQPRDAEPPKRRPCKPSDRRRSTADRRRSAAGWSRSSCRTWTTTCSASSCRKAPTSSIIPIR